MQLYYTTQGSGQSLHLEHLFMIANLKLTGAKLALSFQYQAFFLCMKQMVVAYFYEYQPLNLSITIFVLDASKLIQCCELLYICSTGIDWCYYESSSLF